MFYTGRIGSDLLGLVKPFDFQSRGDASNFKEFLDDRLDEYERKETEKNLETWEELDGFPSWAESVASSYPADEIVLVAIHPEIDFSQGFRELSDSNGSLAYKHMKIYDFVWEADDAGWAVFYNHAIFLGEIEED